MEQKIRQDENIGENLKRLRMQKSLSQQKVCEVLQLMGCDIIRSTYQKYENGELNIKVTVLRKLQEYYNCGYEEFFKPIKKNKRQSAFLNIAMLEIAEKLLEIYMK